MNYTRVGNSCHEAGAFGGRALDPSAPLKLGEVQQNLERVGEILEVVEGLVAELQSRLGPILAPATETGSGRTADSAVTEIGARLQNTELRNIVLAQRLRDLLDRIAL